MVIVLTPLTVVTVSNLDECCVGLFLTSNPAMLQNPLRASATLARTAARARTTWTASTCATVQTTTEASTASTVSAFVVEQTVPFVNQRVTDQIYARRMVMQWFHKVKHHIGNAICTWQENCCVIIQFTSSKKSICSDRWILQKNIT